MEEMKLFRGLCGKLIWLSDQTRPDVAFDVISLTCKNKSATLSTLKSLNKTIRKITSRESFVKYTRIGDLPDMKIVVISDGAYLKLEEKTKSTRGMFILLMAGHQSLSVLLGWKGKTIASVCKSVKDAETRAADKAL